jgi:hypothetical protein
MNSFQIYYHTVFIIYNQQSKSPNSLQNFLEWTGNITTLLFTFLSEATCNALILDNCESGTFLWLVDNCLIVIHPK